MIASNQAHKGVTITDNNAYDILLDILTDDGSMTDPKISACMNFLGGQELTKGTLLQNVKNKLQVYYDSSQLSVNPVTVLGLEAAPFLEE